MTEEEIPLGVFVLGNVGDEADTRCGDSDADFMDSEADFGRGLDDFPFIPAADPGRELATSLPLTLPA